MDVDSEGDVWVGSYVNHVLTEFNPDGTPTGNTVDIGKSSCSLEIDDSGNFYISEYGGEGGSYKFSPTGTKLFQFEPAGDEPRDIAVDNSDGHIYTVHYDHVNEFDESGTLLTEFGREEGSYPGFAFSGEGVAVNEDNPHRLCRALPRLRRRLRTNRRNHHSRRDHRRRERHPHHRDGQRRSGTRRCERRYAGNDLQIRIRDRTEQPVLEQTLRRLVAVQRPGSDDDQQRARNGDDLLLPGHRRQRSPPRGLRPRARSTPSSRRVRLRSPKKPFPKSTPMAPPSRPKSRRAAD